MTLAAMVNLFMLVVVFIVFIVIAVIVHLSDLKLIKLKKTLDLIQDDFTANEEEIYELLRFHGIE